MLRRFSVNFTIFSMLADGLSVLAALISMSYVRLAINDWSFIAYLPGDIEYPTLIYLFFPFVWVFVLAAFSIYDGKKNFKIVDELSTLSIASVVASISQAGILYLAYRDFSRALFLLIIIFSFLLCVFWRLIARLVFRLRKETLDFDHRILVIGKSAELKRVVKETSAKAHLLKNKILQFDLKDLSGVESDPDNSLLVSKVRELIAKEDITDVILAFPRTTPEWIAEISAKIEDLPLGVWVVLDYFDLSLSNARVENLSGLPLLALRAPALDDYSRVFKRIFDILLSSLILILLSPLLIVASILILIFDGWPIFFMQNRVGENGQQFRMIKFRTMVRDAEMLRSTVEQHGEDGTVIHKVRNDPRVTRLGKVLRRFSIDELPQFINVLKGEMSIVGPRPELPYLVENYEHWQRRRLTVPPGITGWWQVNGRSDRIMHLHAEDDIYYIENYSIWLDLQILIRTIWVVIIGKGSF